MPNEAHTDILPNANKITIATSLAPTKDLRIQKNAINSWLHCDFKVIALNIQSEIDLLEHHFPAIEFVVPKRDASEKYEKPYIYIDDILAYFSRKNCKICGIVNSDIHFFKENISAFLHQQTLSSLVFGSRLDIKSFDKTSYGTMYSGFDYFFFDQEFINYYPPSNFCMGLPWWDYWLPLFAIVAKLPVKKVITPICYHLIHPGNYSIAVWRELALEMVKQLSPQQNLSKINLGYFHNFVLNTIKNSSNNIEFTVNNDINRLQS